MTPLTRTLRTGALAAAASMALLVVTGPAALAADRDPAEVEIASHDCTSIDVTSSKAISNVVLEFADGDTQRFEGLPESTTGTFAGTGDHSGEVITTAWIKSGNNKSGDGPGYGERFDFNTSTCDAGQQSDAGQSTGNSAASTDGDDDTGKAGNNTNTGGDRTDANGQAPATKTSQGGDEAAGPGADDDVVTDTGTDTDADTGTGTLSEDHTAAAVATAGTATDDTDDGPSVAADQQTPPARVLGAVLERDAESAMRAADASEVRGAQQLPTTGTHAPFTLAAALAALALGGGMLRRTSRRPV